MGDVTGDATGDVTGDATGDVTGDVTGDAVRSLIDTEKKVEAFHYSERDDWSVGPRIAID